MTRNLSHLSSESRVAGQRPDAEDRVPAPSGGSPPDPPVDLRKWEQVLSLWLEWSELEERLTGDLFTAEGDPQRVEALLDQADRLRKRAVELSHQLLATGDAEL